MLSIFWSRVRWVTFAFVGIFILAGAYGLVMQERMDVVDQTEDYLRRGQTEQQIESMSGRTSLWSIGMEMVADSPLFGHGYQTGARFGGSTYGLQIGTNLHNSHFQVLIDSGLVGYTLWLVFLVSGGWLVLRRRKNDSSAHGDHVTFNVEIAVLSVMLLVRTLIGHAMVALDIGIMFFLSAVMHAYRLSPQDRGEKMPKSLTQDPHKDPRCDNFIKKRPNFIKKRPR
jgi:O-antigen ligase